MILIQKSLATGRKLRKMSLCHKEVSNSVENHHREEKKIGIISLPVMNNEYILVNFQISCF